MKSAVQTEPKLCIRKSDHANRQCIVARKIFWSVFLLIVAYLGVAFTNFSSSTRIDEALRDMGGDTMPVGPYAQEMVKFFNENKRWPTSIEIVLPEPPAAGVVRSVTLEPDGVLVLRLQGLVWLQRTQVKVAVILQPGPEKFGWTSACLDVSPQSIASVIYSHCSRTSLAEAQEVNQKMIASRDSLLK